jgi:hypothetical protein
MMHLTVAEEGSHVHTHRRENLKSHLAFISEEPL